MNPADHLYHYGNLPSTYTPQAEQLMDLEIYVSLIERIGLPAIIIGCAFWYVRYQSDQARIEREEMWAKDSSNDERLMRLVETTTSVMQEMKQALNSNTETMKELLTEFRMMGNRR
jgi:hypothetical protein|tara:strand:+ start:570 stop:917 length:348 start_codon:yes stop_codon:yes gene_type:complete